MTETQRITGPYGGVNVRISAGKGKPIVLIHGNSSSSRAFSRQLDGPLGQRRRLIAPDLMGFGDSEKASDVNGYLLSGQAETVRNVAVALDAADAVFVGWSLGGHVLLEAAPDLTHAKGFAICGTPPIGFPPAMDKAYLPNPAMGVSFELQISRHMAESHVASFFAPGFSDIPAFFVEDALKADGMARAQIYASLDPSLTRDEVEVVEALKVPLAILHGTKETLINGDYFVTLRMPTLWRGAVQRIAGAGHAPQWETPEAFDALIEAFAGDCEG